MVFAAELIAFAVREPLPGVDLDSAERSGVGVSPWGGTSDAQAFHDRLKVAGIAIVTRPDDGPFGRMFTFLGPEGHAITAYAN